MDFLCYLFNLILQSAFNIRPIIMNNKDSEYITTGIYFGIKYILRIRDDMIQ